MNGPAPQRTIALADLNNCYVEAERVWRPALKRVPVCVLSNNDGAVVARSNEARALGIKMSQPWHEVKHFEHSHGLVALSANFELYADMTDRVMSLYAALGHSCERYSIDEQFSDMTGIRGDLVARARALRERVARWVGMPSCVGMGPTKTLAKLANHIAKSAERKPGSYPAEFAQVCHLGLQSTEVLRGLFAATPVEDVWGIGPRISAQLNADGIQTVEQLLRLPPEMVRRRWSVVLEKTVRELRGEACLDLETQPPPKQEIACTRSFGRPVTALVDLQEAVTDYAQRAAAKARGQGSVAGQVLVFIRTSPFRKTAQYSRSVVVPLRRPSADTAAIVGAALLGLQAIYRQGFEYAKGGVMLLDLAPQQQVQFELDLEDEASARPGLMAAMDSINDRFGRGTLGLASAGTPAKPKCWAMRQERRTPAYTTQWDDMPTVRA